LDRARPRHRAQCRHPGCLAERDGLGAFGDRSRLRRGLRGVPRWPRSVAIACLEVAMTVSVASDPVSFLLETTWDSLPTVVRYATIRCLVDLVGALAAGRRTPLSAIVR